MGWKVTGRWELHPRWELRTPSARFSCGDLRSSIHFPRYKGNTWRGNCREVVWFRKVDVRLPGTGNSDPPPRFSPAGISDFAPFNAPGRARLGMTLEPLTAAGKSGAPGDSDPYSRHQFVRVLLRNILIHSIPSPSVRPPSALFSCGELRLLRVVHLSRHKWPGGLFNKDLVQGSPFGVWSLGVRRGMLGRDQTRKVDVRLSALDCRGEVWSSGGLRSLHPALRVYRGTSLIRKRAPH